MNENITTGFEKLQALKDLSTKYDCPFVEFQESVTGPQFLLWKLDLKQFRTEGWFPRTVVDGRATVVAIAPCPALAESIRKTLAVSVVEFQVTLPSDLIRIIEHNQDVNPGFPATAGRTPLAKVRTYLAGRRSLFAHYRTLLSKSRTGLAAIRTGLSFITITLLFLRLVGAGYYLLLEAPLMISGIIMVYDGLKWYLPARAIYGTLPPCIDTGATGGTSVLEAYDEYVAPKFRRSDIVPGAATLRASWTSLSPVMRRRFLASDRTDLAEERTLLACFRTRMAKVRTGLAFTRTGFAFISLGLGLLRQFQTSRWLALDLGLIGIGAIMALEGFFWYARGRQAGIEGQASMRKKARMSTIWDYFFPHRHALPGTDQNPLTLPVRSSHAPGIWATTGLALERTVLAERRNVMARLRTVMARARTGFAFIRTGLSLALIGVGFLLFFDNNGTFGWIVFNSLMIAIGLFLVADGFAWSISAERTRRHFPYCYGDMDIPFPDYGVPTRFWKTVVFSNDES
ncbi:MAG: hypothetical protein PHZ02_08270 [Desulfocapsaceae bacterium]|nr:hypothetical protein [Desulfocapsaceae bacterium]